MCHHILSFLNEPQGYSSLKMDSFDTDAFEWQLAIMFGIWNSAVHGINYWTQVASTYRSTMVLDRVYKAFFYSEDFLDWAHRPHQILLVTFMMALEIKFERALYLHSESYETSDNYGLPQPLNKFTCIYSVPSAAETSFSPTDCQKPMISTSLSTPKQRSVKSPLH